MPPSAIASGQAGALRLLTLLTAWATTSSQFHKFNDNHIELALDKARLEMLQKQFQTIDNLLPGAKSDLWMTAFVQSLAGDAVGHESYKIEEAGIDHYKGVGSGMIFDAETGKIMEHEEVDTTQALNVFDNYCGEHQVGSPQAAGRRTAELRLPATGGKLLHAKGSLGDLRGAQHDGLVNWVPIDGS